MALDVKSILDVRAPWSPVEHERINPLPLVANLFGWHQLAVLPHHGLALALDWALHHSVGECHHVVEERVQCIGPATLDKLVFHLQLHAVNAVVGLFAQLAHRCVFHQAGGLTQLCGVWHRHALLHHGLQLLLHAGHQLLDDLWRHGGLWCSLKAPRLVRACAKQGITQPARSSAALHRCQLDVNLRAALALDVGQFVRVVLTVALTQTLQHALFDGPFGFAGRFPALACVSGQPLDHRLSLHVRVAFLRLPLQIGAASDGDECDACGHNLVPRSTGSGCVWSSNQQEYKH